MTTSFEQGPGEHLTVQIPGSTDHAGHHLITITLQWLCPACGGPRGKVFRTVSYDGSRRLACDGWRNPCGHIDFYSDVRVQAEAAHFRWPGTTADETV